MYVYYTAVLPRKPTTSPPPTKRQLYLADLAQLVQQPERRDRDLPMPSFLPRLPHREVVRERHEGDPRRYNAPLHCQGHRRYSLLLDHPAYQPNGPVTQWSGRREQHGVYPVLQELVGYLGRGLLYQRAGVLDGPHEGEVSVV